MTIRNDLNQVPPSLVGRSTVEETLFFEALRQTARLPTKIDAITTADATDLASAITLVNELKASFNSLIGQLTTAGVLPSD